MLIQFNFVQQCIQISTRINSSMYIVHPSFVLHYVQQWFVDQEFNRMLQNISQAHTQLATSLDTLGARVGKISTMQVEDTAAQISSELSPVRGMDQILQDFLRDDIGLILAVGVRKVQEYQFVKGVGKEEDISSMKTLQGYFGPNVRSISECTRGEKYRYYKETKKRPTSKKIVLKYKMTAEGRPTTVSISKMATTPTATAV